MAECRGAEDIIGKKGGNNVYNITKYKKKFGFI